MNCEYIKLYTLVAFIILYTTFSKRHHASQERGSIKNAFPSSFSAKKNFNSVSKYAETPNEMGYFKNTNKGMCLMLISLGFENQ